MVSQNPSFDTTWVQRSGDDPLITISAVKLFQEDDVACLALTIQRFSSPRSPLWAISEGIKIKSTEPMSTR